MFFTEKDKERIIGNYKKVVKTDADKIKEDYIKEKGFINLDKKRNNLNTSTSRVKSYFGIKSIDNDKKKETQGFKLRPRKKELQFF